MMTESISLSELTTKKINSLLLKRDELADKDYLKFENELLSTYKRSLIEIKSQISGMYEKYGDKVTLAEMYSYNRLKNLEKQIAKEINKLNANVTIKTRGALKTFFAENYYLTGYAIEKSVELKLGFGLLNPKVIESAVQNPYNWEGRLKLWNEKLLIDIKQNVVDGLTQGKGFAKTTKAIQTTFEKNLGKRAAGEIKRSNILRVVRTESTRAQETGNVAGYSQADKDAEDLGIDMQKVWDATLDGRTRPNHGAMDGVAVGVNELFNFVTMDGISVKVEAPHKTNTTDDINCRCTSRLQIAGFEPKMRKDNIIKQLIPNISYNEWKAGLK